MKTLDAMIEDMYQKKSDRGWDTLYWLVDVHDTIIKSTYNVDEEFAETYPYCFAALRLISQQEHCKLVLWTSSYPKYAKSLMKWLKLYDINFDYFNENPECKNTKTGDFTSKIYANIILDDKAGFDPDNDWEIIFNKLESMSND